MKLVACSNSFVMLAVALLVAGCGKHGAEELLINSACEGDVGRCERLIEGGEPVDAVDSQGDTALVWAVYCCKVDVVRRLIELGADVNHVDNHFDGYGGCTPLVYTATTLRGHVLNGTPAERTQIAKLLIEHGADVNKGIGDGRAKGSGETALHFAAIDKNVTLVRLLLSSGANRNAKDTSGLTPLDVAKFPDYAPNDEVIKALEGR